MSIEERKAYNKSYYTNNKKRITDMLLKKVECKLCSREITYTNLQRHRITSLCINNRKSNLTDIDILKQQVEKLSEEIKQLKLS